ncbi:hypothetical protein KKC13_02535 [bacterium]|nr:hypothetical protein [bacterium]MBU1958956.1 hypothetical protein [bacterium]
MKFIATRCLALSALLLAFNVSAYAESAPALPTSKQLSKEADTAKSEKIEIVDEIKIQTDTSTKKSNPALKEGEACDDQKLEAAELGPDDYIDVPMAETMPCDTVDCSDLKPAKLHKDTFKKLPMAKTEKLVPCKK